MLKDLQRVKGVTFFIYFADHADDVIRKLGHDSNRFTFEMTEIPMIAWCSQPYKQSRPNSYGNLQNHTRSIFGNDLFYDTFLGITGIESNRYDARFDLSSGSYSLDASTALVLHGQRHYTDKGNYIYWQEENTNYLLTSKQSTRTFPHRVNSVGKLKEIWRAGFRSIEVDVRFGLEGTDHFQVGPMKA